MESIEPAMMLRSCLQLAWLYTARHVGRSALLAIALGLTLALPVVISTLMRQAEHELRARAADSPLVLGAKGSALELTLSTLYFRIRGVESIPVKQAAAVRATGLAETIPLYVRFHSQDAPIVGTTLAYFTYRHLHFAQGQTLLRLGDCVLGAHVAKARSLGPGSSIYSSPEQVFDLAGVYPMKLRVTGVLAETHTADDEAIFVDLKTAWIIEGIGHGHEDLVKAPQSALLEKQEGNMVANNSVRLYNEVTTENFASFHFHGDPEEFPISSVLVAPHDAKAQAILLGRYQNGQQTAQLVRPLEEMDALLATLFQAEKFALVVVSALGLLVLLIAALVFALSFRLRREEFATLEDIGISGSTLALVKALEMMLVGAAALLVVAGSYELAMVFGPELIRLGVR